jgi:hypothetical protein
VGGWAWAWGLGIDWAGAWGPMLGIGFITDEGLNIGPVGGNFWGTWVSGWVWILLAVPWGAGLGSDVM